MSEKPIVAPRPQPTESGTPSPTPHLWAWSDRFVRRHIGPDEEEVRFMAKMCGFATLDDLIDTVVPSQIRLRKPLNLPVSRSEHGLLSELKQIASTNQPVRSFIRMVYH